METKEFEKLAAKAIVDWYEEKGIKMDPEKVNTVWQAKILQNYKGIYCTDDYHYMFEVTFNGDKNEMYIDAYLKESNRKVKVNDSSHNIISSKTYISARGPLEFEVTGTRY